MSIATITLLSDVSELKAGEKTEFQFTVVNDKASPMRLGFRIECDDSSHARHFELDGDVERDFDDRETQTVVVKATAPDAAGDYSFNLRVYETDDPESTVSSLQASIKVAGEAPAVVPAAAKKKSILPWVLGGVGAFVLLVGVGIAVFFMTRGPGAVPNVTAMHFDEALQLLDKEELQGIVSEIVSEGDEIPEPGTVLSQDPPAGADRPESGNVQLTVEIFAVEVPNLVSKSLEEAQALLAEFELEVGAVTQVSARSPTVKVLGQDPAAGQRVIPTTPVNLQVAQQKVMVPSLVGQTILDAGKALSDLGLRAGSVVEKKTGGSKGAILSTKPAAGSQVQAGSRVTLFVETEKFKMPNVTRQKSSIAMRTLRAKGLTVKIANRRTGKVPAGTVLSQSPRAGTTMSPGKATQLFVESKPPRRFNRPQIATTLLQQQMLKVQKGQIAFKVDNRTKVRRIVPPAESEPESQE